MKNYSINFTVFILILILVLTTTSIGHTDWATAIDTTWGQGLSTEEKLAIFDEAWSILNAEFPVFYGLNPDTMDSLREFIFYYQNDK